MMKNKKIVPAIAMAALLTMPLMTHAEFLGDVKEGINSVRETIKELREENTRSWQKLIEENARRWQEWNKLDPNDPGEIVGRKGTDEYKKSYTLVKNREWAMGMLTGRWVKSRAWYYGSGESQFRDHESKTPTDACQGAREYFTKELAQDHPWKEDRWQLDDYYPMDFCLADMTAYKAHVEKTEAEQKQAAEAAKQAEEAEKQARRDRFEAEKKAEEARLAKEEEERLARDKEKILSGINEFKKNAAYTLAKSFGNTDTTAKEFCQREYKGKYRFICEEKLEPELAIIFRAIKIGGFPISGCKQWVIKNRGSAIKAGYDMRVNPFGASKETVRYQGQIIESDSNAFLISDENGVTAKILLNANGPIFDKKNIRIGYSIEGFGRHTGALAKTSSGNVAVITSDCMQLARN